MKSRILSILFLLAFCHTALCETSELTLVGSWHSNKELSVKTIHYKKDIPENLRLKLESIFGQLTITYDGNQVTEYAPNLGENGKEFRYNSAYKVLGHDENSLVIMLKNPGNNKDLLMHIHFDNPDRFWVYLEDTGWKEYFDRIKP